MPVATADVFVTFAPALDLACAVALFKGARAAWFRDVALVFRAELFAAADFEAAVPDLAAVLDAADAAFLDTVEVAFLDATAVDFLDATGVARDLLDAAAVFRDVDVRLDEIAARVAFVFGALDVFGALVLTDDVFTELFFAEAFAIVFALLACALDATAFEVNAFAAFGALAFFTLVFFDDVEDLGGMVGTLPG